ncbi:alpha/beta hydrolase [Lachnospiraceae bacterium ZAX-1]
MEKHQLMIESIPAFLWGEKTGKLFIAVHGDRSHKRDSDITILADEAVKKGYQVLSFDLPENGERERETYPCNPWNAVKDLHKILDYAHRITDDISLYGCSIGAYFSMLAYQCEDIKQTIFLSPVVDMERIIENMMKWFDISEEKLRQEKEIETPIKTLYWDYYQYVREHSVKWNKPIAILYGSQDNLCEIEYVKRFAEQAQANLTILEDGEHYFHTEKQLDYFRYWLESSIV